MTGNGTSTRMRRAAAVAACAMAMGVVVAPAADAAPAAPAVVAVKASCGNPEIEAWYDKDQFGTYLKVWFKTPKGCKKGKRISNFSADVYCTTTKKRVYHVNVASKKAPYETVVKAMPAKNKCKNFYAKATLVYFPFTAKFTDTWRWKWGDYPA